MSDTPPNLRCTHCGSTDFVNDASVQQNDESTECLSRKPVATASLLDSAHEDGPLAEDLKSYTVSSRYLGDIGFLVNAIDPGEAARYVAKDLDTDANHWVFVVENTLTNEKFDVFVCGEITHVSSSFDSVFAHSRVIPLIDVFFERSESEESQRTEVALKVWEHILDTNFGEGAQCLDLFDRAFMLICDQRFSLVEARCLAINLSPAVLEVSNLLDVDKGAQYNQVRHVVPFIFNALTPALRDIKELANGVQRTISHHDASRLAALVSQQLCQL